MIKNLWSFISRLGIRSDHDLKQIKRYTLINQYLFIALIIYFINGLTDLFYGYIIDAIVLLFSTALFTGILFSKRQHHPVSVTVMFIYIALTIFYFGTFASIQAGDYLYYFPLVLAIAFTFDFKQDRKIMVFLFCFITLLLLVYAFTYDSSADIHMESQSERYQMFMINLTISAATVGFFIYLTVEDNRINSQLFEQRLKEREESEAIIKKTLAEKEILLQELHHRVKNNLAVIVGYFNLKINSTNNEEAKAVLLESKNHVNSMALIHNRLYKTSNFSEMNFSTYLKDLLVEIQESYPTKLRSVKVETHIEDLKMNLSTAVPCALILNELLNNCYKHAFKADQQGLIQIDLRIGNDEEILLLVKDNGVGLKEDYDKHDSLGLSVITGLSEQLNGQCRFFNDGGACFTLSFKRNPA